MEKIKYLSMGEGPNYLAGLLCN